MLLYVVSWVKTILGALPTPYFIEHSEGTSFSCLRALCEGCLSQAPLPIISNLDLTTKGKDQLSEFSTHISWALSECLKRHGLSPVGSRQRLPAFDDPTVQRHAKVSMVQYIQVVPKTISIHDRFLIGTTSSLSSFRRAR